MILEKPDNTLLALLSGWPTNFYKSITIKIGSYLK